MLVLQTSSSIFLVGGFLDALDAILVGSGLTSDNRKA
jgi:hypothetical protein